MRIFRTLMMAGMGYAAYKGYQRYRASHPSTAMTSGPLGP